MNIGRGGCDLKYEFMLNNNRTSSREKRCRGLNWWLKVCIWIIYQRERWRVIRKKADAQPNVNLSESEEEEAERERKGEGEERRGEERRGEERRICDSLTCC